MSAYPSTRNRRGDSGSCITQYKAPLSAFSRHRGARTFSCRAASTSGRDHCVNVGCVKPLVARFDFELHLLSFCQRLEAFHRDRGEVHENVLSSLLLNEAISLGIIEPFHLSPGHVRRLRHVIRVRAYIESARFFVKSLIKTWQPEILSEAGDVRLCFETLSH